MAKYIAKTKADLVQEAKEKDDEIKRLADEIERLKSETETLRTDFATIKQDASQNKEKRLITADEFQARSINPGNIKKRIKKAGWPPNIEAAILEKAL